MGYHQQYKTTIFTLAKFILLHLLPKSSHTMPTYTRPGVEAAVRLSKVVEQNKQLWTSIEARYNDMLVVKKKGKKDLLQLDKECEELGSKWKSTDNGKDDMKNDNGAFMTCEQLYLIMKWKFSKGKSRPLWQYINSNSEASVRKHSNIAFSKICEDENDVNGAINELCNLKGIGAAGASAILSLFKPEIFVFMDDEVIECLHDGKREYNLKVYTIINDKCKKIAAKLGDEWTPRRVGKALWSAAIISGYTDEEDLTMGSAIASSNDTSRVIKRQKTSK